MKTEDCIKVGYVLKPHGLKGEVTIALDPDFPDDAEGINSIFIDFNNNLVPYFISSISLKGNKAFVKFDEVDTPEAARDISRKSLFLPRSIRPKSARGEFYDDEIIGFEVTDENAGPLGKVIEVSQAGPNKLLVIRHDGKEVLIPVNSPFIKSVNKSKGTISVVLPEGFLDI